MLRILPIVLAGALLGGCTNTDWDHALSYAGLGSSDKPAEQAAPAEAAAPAAGPAMAQTNSAWCEDVAKATQIDAAQQGFDTATQQQRAKAAYAQCATGHVATN